MEWEVKLFSDLPKMKEEMDLGWDPLSRQNPIPGEWDVERWVETLPKFEGTGRRNLKSRPNKIFK